MELTFGTQQMHTSQRMINRPVLSKLFRTLFGYTNVGNYARFTIFKKLVNQVALPDNAKVLDLGTGYGEYAFSLAEALPKAKIHALDVDSERVAAVNEAVKRSGIKNLNTHCCFTDALDQEAFDFIFSIDVFEHIAPNEMPFKAAIQRLKPGGQLMVKIPNKEQKTILPERLFEEHHDWLEDEHIGQVYDLEGLKQRFEAEGLTITHASYSDGWLSRLAWELAYLGKKASVVTQLLSLPMAKCLIQLDRLVHHNRWGNAIQVIGQKH